MAFNSLAELDKQSESIVEGPEKYNKISQLEIPTGNPLLISFNQEKKISECFYLDKERAQDLIVF